MSQPQFSVYDYEPAGPVCAAYIHDMADGVVGIKGPAGSGKTVGSVMKAASFAAIMPPCRDGVIRAKITVLRDTYRSLYRTTLASWQRFFPEDFPGSTFRGGTDRPAEHLVRFRLGNGRLAELLVDFFAIGDHAIEEMLRGYETSVFWLNEADLMHPRVPTFAFSRTGRYPSLEQLVPGARRPRLVFMDFNPTDFDHPFYKAFVSEKRPGWRLYEQPSGLSPQAENRKGKTLEEYEADRDALTPGDVRRFVHGEWGWSSDGQPVYPEFDPSVHIAPGPLKPVAGLPLLGGADGSTGGLRPAGIFAQAMPNGQLRVLGELVPGHGVGPERFAEMLVDMLVREAAVPAFGFRGLPLGAWTADPASFYGADKEGGKLAWVETLMKALGHRIDPAPTNEPAIRIEAVRHYLARRIDGNTPAFLIDPRCRMLIAGFSGKYKYRRVRIGAAERLEDRPFKDEYSDPHDALQYLVLGFRGRAGVIESAARAGRPGNVVQLPVRSAARTDFDVWSV